MALTLEETKKIKNHLLQQLGNFPEEKREEIKEKIEAMPSSQVEEFVRENQLNHLGNQCIFCSIVAGTNPSFKIGESGRNIAILEINPLSKGHALVVPKEHAESIEEHTKKFAAEVGKLLAEKLKPQKVSINELKIMDHALLEVVPLFGNEKERWSATPEELKSLQEEILKPKEVELPPEPEPEPEPEKPMRLTKLPPRIP